MTVRTALLLAASLWLAGGPAGAEELDPWQRAILVDDLPQLERLIADGQDVNAPTPSGKTALMAAVKVGDTELVERLLAAGADVRAANLKGGTVLMYAMLSGRPSITRRLLGEGAPPNSLTTTGWSALMIASAKDRAPLAELLLRHGADPNQQDIYGWTPLIRAAHEGHTQTLRVLLGAPGVKLSVRDENGQTALHHAALRGGADDVAALLAAGADKMLRDARGATPAELAKAAGHAHAAQLLGSN